ncbi:MAG: hypothetical protein IBJ16_14885 [Chitinophagaceae bacterium]|nr:hypothetical protein [Chitinophagaceae bacterium]
MYNPQSGEWKAQSGKTVIEQKTSITYPVENIQPLPDAQDKRVESISSHIQDTILENVKTRNLYFFARTMTSATESSLGWVSISSLFEVKDLLAASIDKIYLWIERIFPLDQSKKPILIGLGFWGGILASHINARRDSSCFLISSHRIPHNQVYFESINYVVDSLVGVDFDSVIIITDVISTGNSIVRVKKELETKYPSQCKKFVAVSVLSDKNQHRLQQLNEFYKIGSLCIDLPIPVIDNDKLPDHSIFPVEYDFR